ncbi:MAG: polar amino acid transporter permease [Herbaspirillum sp.]|jgi:polar amino acid transport system permease protein|nr:polar amino acid transporter permease [Herbaspirillum sp.]
MGDFAIIWSERAGVLEGLLNTMGLVAIGSVLSLLLGALVTPMLMSRRKAIARIATIYVDAMRCVPFLLFVYLIYFGLPSLGVRFSSWWSGALALVLYNAAYMAELLRGAWQKLPESMIEAGHAFGFTGFTLLRRIVLPPVILRAVPMIGNQLIQILKDSAFLTVIAVSELTHELTGIQSMHFIPFAAFLTAVLLYWGVCLLIEGGVALLNRLAEERKS